MENSDRMRISLDAIVGYMGSFQRFCKRLPEFSLRLSSFNTAGGGLPFPKRVVLLFEADFAPLSRIFEKVRECDITFPYDGNECVRFRREMRK